MKFKYSTIRGIEAKDKIKELCNNGTFNNSTHEEVYQHLIMAGYMKK